MKTSEDIHPMFVARGVAIVVTTLRVVTVRPQSLRNVSFYESALRHHAERDDYNGLRHKSVDHDGSKMHSLDSE